MRQRGTYVIVGALGLAALAGLSGCGRAGTSHAVATRARPVSATMTVNSVVTFAPPPADAAPAMTAEQAWAQWENHAGSTNTSIAPGTTVQLGLLTVLVGPDCGAECENGNIVQDGMVYSALNQLAYGYNWSTCTAGSTLPASQCTEWIWLDASTGEMITGVLPQIQGANPAGQTASPSGDSLRAHGYGDTESGISLHAFVTDISRSRGTRAGSPAIDSNLIWAGRVTHVTETPLHLRQGSVDLSAARLGAGGFTFLFAPILAGPHHQTSRRGVDGAEFARELLATNQRSFLSYGLTEMEATMATRTRSIFAMGLPLLAGR